MKFSVEDFFSKCDQIRSFLRIRAHLLKKSLTENFIFFAVPIYRWYVQIKGKAWQNIFTFADINSKHLIFLTLNVGLICILLLCILFISILFLLLRFTNCFKTQNAQHITQQLALVYTNLGRKYFKIYELEYTYCQYFKK